MMPSSTPGTVQDTASDTTGRPIGRRRYWLAIAIGLASLLLTLGAWRWLSHEQSQSIETEFTLEADQRAEGIKRQFAAETSVIKALLGYYQASDTISPAHRLRLGIGPVRARGNPGGTQQRGDQRRRACQIAPHHR